MLYYFIVLCDFICEAPRINVQTEHELGKKSMFVK